MMKRGGADELREAMMKCRWHFAAVGVFSVFVNLLMLTGPLFMLQIYDRVLSSRSEATLVALLGLVTVLFAFMGILDFIRGRVLARAGAKFQTLLDRRVFTAVIRRSVAPHDRAMPNTAARDLDSIKQILSGPAPFAVFDLPWTPIFVLAIFVFHPVLGWVAVFGALILVCLTILNQIRSKEPNQESQIATNQAEQLGEALRQNAEAVRGLGMRDAAMSRWESLRGRALERQILASDRTASFSSASKSLRFYLQSLMLAVGAWLVLQQQISPGMMIAGSILLGRALAPVEQAIGQWAMMQRARRGWASLKELLEKTPEEPQKTALPAPKGVVEVQKVSVAAPGEQRAALMQIDFRVEPGQALGVIGPSGAGKTTLAKVLTGIWRPAQGKIRIDGAAIEQWPEDEIGKHLGYLPQEIGLMQGTVAENIARLGEKDDAKIVEAAQKAGAHDLLLELPQGYDTEIGAGGQRLSGGQRQRVALARALYNDPPVLVLDEPNANLDAQGEQALVDAIRDAKSRGKTVIIMAHRPSAIAACDLLLMIDRGKQVDYGPRDEVLKRRTKNYTQLVQPRRDAPPQAQPAPAPAAQAQPAAAPHVAHPPRMRPAEEEARPAAQAESAVTASGMGQPVSVTATYGEMPASRRERRMRVSGRAPSAMPVTEPSAPETPAQEPAPVAAPAPGPASPAAAPAARGPQPGSSGPVAKDVEAERHAPAPMDVDAADIDPGSQVREVEDPRTVDGEIVEPPSESRVPGRLPAETGDGRGMEGEGAAGVTDVVSARTAQDHAPGEETTALDGDVTAAADGREPTAAGSAATEAAGGAEDADAAGRPMPDAAAATGPETADPVQDEAVRSAAFSTPPHGRAGASKDDANDDGDTDDAAGGDAPMLLGDSVRVREDKR